MSGPQSQNLPLTRSASEGIRIGPRWRFGLVAGAASVLLWFVASPAFAQEPLRWKLATGDQLKVDVSQQTTSTVTIASKPVKTTMQMALETLWTVDSADDKQIKITQSVKRLTMRLQVGDGAPVAYDSATKTTPVGAAKNVAAAVKPLLEEGAGIVITMDTRGDVLSAEPTTKLAALWKTSVQGATGEAKGQESAEELLKRSLVLLPEKALAPGDIGKAKWTKEREVEIAIGKVKQSTTFVYAGEAEESGLKLDKIEFTSKLTLVPGGAKGLKLTIKEQEQTGHALFSAEHGRVVSAVQTQHLVTEAPYRETIITVAVDSTVTTTIKK